MTYAAHDHMGSTVTSDLMTMHLLSVVRGFVAMGMTTCAPSDLILGRNTAVHSAFVHTQLLVWTIVTCNMCNKSDISSHTHSWKAWQFCLYYLAAVLEGLGLNFRKAEVANQDVSFLFSHFCRLNLKSIKPNQIYRIWLINGKKWSQTGWEIKQVPATL